MEKKKKATAISILLLFAAICLSGCGSQTKENGTIDNLKSAPDFDLENLWGGRAKLSDYRGKVVILNFWATWCAPCRMELPEFIELQKEYNDKGLAILGISVDQNPKQTLSRFFGNHKLNYPILLEDGKVSNDYGNFSGIIPTTFVIDQKGEIYKKYTGARPKQVFEEDIKTLLKN